MNDPSMCRLIANPHLLKPMQPPANYSQGKSKEYIQRFLRSEYKDLYITESLVDLISIKIRETLHEYDINCVVNQCICDMLDSLCQEYEIKTQPVYVENDPENLGFLPLLLHPDSEEDTTDEMQDTETDTDTCSVNDTSDVNSDVNTPHSSYGSDTSETSGLSI
uniref:Uncharacterized protein n=1 Tax=viral metagenome TaxID=1070528 RepID=A0A6C0F567_9ZZZZ|tara:strand:+ start:4619 stop:5110 length:492 start_codon:yes stop_codon:yes gene_type:complete